MASSFKPTLTGLPKHLLDDLVSYTLDVCPTLTSSFLHEMGSQVHASAVKAVFSTLNVPDDARCFMQETQKSVLSRHPLSAILLNPTRYAHIVKRIVVDEVQAFTTQPAWSNNTTGALGLVTVYEDNEESDEEMVTTKAKRGGRIAVQPMGAKDLTELLAFCGELEGFVWRSSNPPPDGIFEVLSGQCPKLSSFIFRPDPPLRAASIDTVADIPLPSSRTNVVKWDAPSFRFPSGLSLTQLHITRLSQSGSQALVSFLKRVGDESVLEDVSLDLVWLDDVCEQLVKAGRRIKKLQLGTSGTKLTDKDIIIIFEGCEALEEFALVEAEARLSRKLWSKIKSTPPRLRKFTIQISESGPHHSWSADHLESFASLNLASVTHLSIKRLLPFPQLTKNENELEYDSKVDNVAALKPIPSDVVEAIRTMPSLTNLQCDWWSWRMDDIRALAERCTTLEHLELALDLSFAKLLSMTSTFTGLTQLHYLAVCIPPVHSPGLVPPLLSPLKLPVHPLTPAASPVRRRTSLPSPVSDFASQVFVGEDVKIREQGDISFPPLREVKKFVKKCPKLLELEWYGRNARGRWLISRPSTSGSSKLSPNVSAEYIPPVVSVTAWSRATSEKAALDFVTSGNGTLSYNIHRQGQAWTGPKAEECKSNILDKEKEKDHIPSVITTARDKSNKVSSSNKRERVSTSSSGSGCSSTLAHSDTKSENASITSPISPVSQGLSPLELETESPVGEHIPSPSSSQFLPRGSIPNESPMRADNLEAPRFRRATLSEIDNAHPAVVVTATSTPTPFSGSFRTNIQSRPELMSRGDLGRRNGSTSTNSEAYMRTVPRGRGNSYTRSHGAPRGRGHGGSERGRQGNGDSKRGFTNNFMSSGRGFAGGSSRRGSTVPM